MTKAAPSEKAYGQFLSSASLLAGSQAISYAVSLLKIKIAAVFLGPTGVGAMYLLQSLMIIVRGTSGMGINSSGVREIAMAHASDDPLKLALCTKTLRYVCWATGLIGLSILAASANPLSHWMFGDNQWQFQVGLLGIAVLLNSVSGGLSTILQGTRRIKQTAMTAVLTAVLTTPIVSFIYYAMREHGIALALIMTEVVYLSLYWYFARQVKLVPCNLDWQEGWQRTKELIRLGLPFMWTVLLTSATFFLVRGIVSHTHGLDAVGVYSAAWALSGMFSQFVLEAMAADLYPRLSAVSHNHQKANQYVNETVEISSLVFAPGAVFIIVFAPLLVRMIFSEKFLVAADLIPLMVLGISFQLVAWPLSILQRATGAAHWLYLTQTQLTVLVLALSLLLGEWFGMKGFAFAIPISYGLYLVTNYIVAKRLSGFRYSPEALRVIFCSLLAVVASALLVQLVAEPASYVLGTLLIAVVSYFSLSALASRISKISTFIAVVVTRIAALFKKSPKIPSATTKE